MGLFMLSYWSSCDSWGHRPTESRSGLACANRELRTVSCTYCTVSSPGSPQQYTGGDEFPLYTQVTACMQFALASSSVPNDAGPFAWRDAMTEHDEGMGGGGVS